MRDEIDCGVFEESVGELVLDLLEPAEQAALLHHAAGCARCQAELNSLSAIADQLATAAPECEPPTGFEARVVATFAAPGAEGARTLPFVRRRPVATALLAAAAAALLGVWTGTVLDRAEPAPSAAPAVVAGTLQGDDGSEHGWVLLTAGDRPGVTTLTMHLSDLPRGTYRCLLVADDGATTEVAAWPIDESGWGQWSVAIDRAPEASTVIVVAGSGATIASAALHPA